MNLHKDIKSKFNSDEQELLNYAELAAKKSYVKLYLVGGPVRDLLLGNLSHDLDLLIEGEIDLFIAEFNKITHSEPIRSSQFKTFKYKINDYEIDIALARTEIYKFPGSLPEITPGSITKDLYRRDFTINAIALQIFPKPYKIIDPINGIEEVRNKIIKIIHEKSFQDDPTRIFRALRYSTRLNFPIDKNTSILINRDINYLNTLSAKRIINELFKYLTEKDIYKSLSSLTKYDLLHIIDRNFPTNENFVKHLNIFKEQIFSITDKELILLAILSSTMNQNKLNNFISRFSLSKRISRILIDLNKINKKISYISFMKRPSSIANLFDKYDVEALRIASIVTGNKKFTEHINNYLNIWAKIKPYNNGDEIIEMISIDKTKLSLIIEKLRNAQINGKINSKSDEKIFLEKLNKQLFK